MKFEDALKIMREGKPVRLGSCRCGFIIDVMPDYKTIINQDGKVVSFVGVDIMSEDWEIVEDSE